MMHRSQLLAGREVKDASHRSTLHLDRGKQIIHHPHRVHVPFSQEHLLTPNHLNLRDAQMPEANAAIRAGMKVGHSSSPVGV
jgi:hypothetical protein